MRSMLPEPLERCGGTLISGIAILTAVGQRIFSSQDFLRSESGFVIPQNKKQAASAACYATSGCSNGGRVFLRGSIFEDSSGFSRAIG